MRDIAIFLIVAIGIPFILRNPAVGIGYWVWLSLMNPHRAAWGFAYSFQFAFVVAIATVIGLFITKESRQLQRRRGDMGIVCLCHVDVLHNIVRARAGGSRQDARTRDEDSVRHIPGAVHTSKARTCQVANVNHRFFDRLLRRQGRRVHAQRGGADLVWGPPETFIADNNALALAVIMTIPLLAYFYIMSTKRWIRAAIVVSIGLCAASALGSYSRGGLLAIIAMSAFLWLKSKGKVWLGLVVVLLALGFYSFMPPAVGTANGHDRHV